MLILRGPGGFSGGKVSQALVSQLDLFPTLCELLEVPPPAWLQGTSLMPLVRGEVAEVNEAIYAEHEAHAVPEPHASVRTRRYKYIRRLASHYRYRPANTDDTYTKTLWLEEGWPERLLEPEQLYDLKTDPLELRNLTDDPTYAAVLLEMRGLMLARAERYNNPLLHRYGVSLEPPTLQGDLEPRSYVLPQGVTEEEAEIGMIYTP